MANIKGAKRGQEKARKPSIAKDSASSVSTTKILYGLSEGEVVGLADGAASIRLEGTPLVDENNQPNFEGVTWDFREGSNDQDYIKGFPDVSNETGIGVELKSSTPWVRAFSDTQLSALRVRFRWDRLLQTNDENGDVTGYKIEYAIDLKTDNGAYQEVLNTKIEDKTSAGYERTHRIDLPRATTGWTIRIRRLTANSTSEYIADKMYIDAIAEVIDVKLKYPNTALLGVQYSAETFSRIAKLEVDTIGKIIRVPSNYNAVNKTYSGIWNGTFKDAYSNNPAWVYYDLVTQWRYGIGEKLDASMIDKWSIYALGQYCDAKVSDGQGGLEPRFECNVYLQKQEDAYQVLQHLGGIFTAMSYWNGEQIVLDADVPQDPVYTFSAANVVGGEDGFTLSGTRQRDRHTLAKVAWDNPNNSYQTEYEYVRDEEAMAKYGVKPLDLSAFGCTSQAQAQRLGLRALKAEQLETQQITFSVGLDGFIPQVGNIINISSELFVGRALNGRVSTVNSTGRIIELDREVAANVGDTLVINGANGKSERKNISNVVGNRITVTGGFVNAESENVWAIETPTLKLMRFRVMQISQNDDATFSIVALQHDQSKYAGIDNGTDVKDTHNNAGSNSVLQPTDKIDAPVNVVISPRYRVEQGLSITTLVVQWNQVSNAVGYIVELKKDSEAWRPLPRTATNYIELDNAYAGTYTARVRAISPFGVESASTESVPTVIAQKANVPTAPLRLSVYGILFGMQLNWAFGTGSENTAFTEIEQCPYPLSEAGISQQGIYAYPTDNVNIQGLGADQIVLYRARLIDKFGKADAWTEWVEGQVTNDAGIILDILGGKITQSELDIGLSQKIDKIDAIEGDLDIKIPDIILEISANNALIQKEIRDRTAEITLASGNLQRSIDAEGAERLRLTNGLAQDIVNETTIRKNETGVLTEQFNGVYAQMNPQMAGSVNGWAGDNTYFAGVWSLQSAIIEEGLARAQKLDVVTANINENKASIIQNNTALVTKTSVTASQINNLSAQMVGGYNGNNLNELTSGLIHQERTARATDVEGLALEMSLLSAGVGEQFDAFEIWHFNKDADGWTGGAYQNGWLNVKTTALTSPNIVDLDGGVYKHIKLRIQKIGTPTWQGLLTYIGGSMTINQPQYDADDIALVNFYTNWTGFIANIAIKLASVADDNNYFLVDWIAVGRPSPAASTAALLRESKARSTKDEAIVEDQKALNTQINGNTSASIVNKLKTVSDATGSTAEALDNLSAAYETDMYSYEGIISTNKRTAATATGVVSEKIDGVYAQVNPSMAGDTTSFAGNNIVSVGVWSLSSAIIEEGLKQGQRVDAVEVETDKNRASIKTTNTALIDGLKSSASRTDTLRVEYENNAATVQNKITAITDPVNGSIASAVRTVQAVADSAKSKAENAQNRLTPIEQNIGTVRIQDLASASDLNAAAGRITTIQRTLDGVTDSVEVVSAVGDLDSLKGDISKVRLDADAAKLRAQEGNLVNLIARYDTLILQMEQARDAALPAYKQGYTNKITQLTNAKADANTQKSAINSQVTKINNEINMFASLRSTEAQILGQHTIKLDAGGLVAGYGLAVSRDGYPTATSTFAIRADQFYIAPSIKDDATGAAKKPAFIYLASPTPETDPVTGITTIIPAGMYLENAFIKEASITTAKIRGQAVSVVDAAENRNSMTSPIVRVNAAGNKILVRVVFYQPSLYGAHTFSIYKDGYLMQAYPASVSSGGGGLTFPSIVIETPTAGGHGETTFYATATGAVSSVAAITISATSLKR